MDAVWTQISVCSTSKSIHLLSAGVLQMWTLKGSLCTQLVFKDLEICH